MSPLRNRLRHQPEPSNDLGFGSVVSRESTRRLLNRDGSFNVAREGIPWFSSMSLYHTLVTTTWTRFLGLVTLGYVAANVLFAAAYFTLGPMALHGPATATPLQYLLQCFFFSVQTLATIGYGVVSPATLTANLIVAVESVAGLVGFAVVSGIAFARFARPVGRFMFSELAVIAPYQEGMALMFRTTNARQNQMLDVHARVLMVRRTEDGRPGREYHELALERAHVAFFPLVWTVVHPINETSPLWGEDAASLRACEPEFIVLVSGVDETFSQTVFARTSYRGDEVEFGARFVDVFDRSRDDGVLRADVTRLSEVERQVP
ncbi:MAG TPA: ion channel [Gemmatimonadales bacterium]|nr:ion channel [Gemmatimonadales bacterium]